MTAANETEIALERKRKTGTRCARQARPTRTAIMIGSSTSIRWARDAARSAIKPAKVTELT